MAIQRSEAVVLRRQDLRETSLIVTFYTKTSGKIKGILRGVRGARVQLGGGGLELFSYDDIVFYERKRSEIFTVSQCDLIEYFNPVRSSLDKLSYAAYIIELLDSVTTLGDPHEEVFELLVNCLRMLSGEASSRRVARIFEIKLLDHLGLMPALSECPVCGASSDGAVSFSLSHGGLLCAKCASKEAVAHPILPGTVKFMEYIKSQPFDKAARVKVAQEVGKDLERTLRRFLDYHIGRRLKTVEFIRATEKAPE